MRNIIPLTRAARKLCSSNCTSPSPFAVTRHAALPALELELELELSRFGAPAMTRRTGRRHEELAETPSACLKSRTQAGPLAGTADRKQPMPRLVPPAVQPTVSSTACSETTLSCLHVHRAGSDTGTSRRYN